MNHNNDGFGPRLRKQREALGLSQEQLAAKTQVAKNTLSNYERGLREPTLVYLVKLGELGFDVPELLAAAGVDFLRKASEAEAPRRAGELPPYEGPPLPDELHEQVARWYALAQKYEDPQFTEAVHQLAHTQAQQLRTREPLVQRLSAIAQGCDDAHLFLLISVAEAFRKATLRDATSVN